MLIFGSVKYEDVNIWEGKSTRVLIFVGLPLLGRPILLLQGKVHAHSNLHLVLYKYLRAGPLENKHDIYFLDYSS